MGRTDISDQFRKIIIRHKRIGYDSNVMRQSACLVINPMMARPKAIHLVGWDRSSLSVAWSTGAQLMILFCFRFPVVLFDRPEISICRATRCICCPRLCFFIVLSCDLCVYRDDSLTS